MIDSPLNAQQFPFLCGIIIVKDNKNLEATMKKKYAFILMGSNYNTKEHHACFEGKEQMTYIFTVNNLEQAREKVVSLEKEGFGAIELCGAFGKENAEKMIELTHNNIAIGYVTHNPKQDSLFSSFFSE